MSFEHADIGRLEPVGPVTVVSERDLLSTSPMMPPSTSVAAAAAPAPPPSPHQPASGLGPSAPGGCQRLSTFSFEEDAVKFGDAPNSHVQVTLRRRHLLQRDFVVELQFRTFYPSGMLFLIPGGVGGASATSGGARQRQYLTAYLLDGILQVVYKGRSKLEVSLPNTYNDGQWHTVSGSGLFHASVRMHRI